MRDTCQRVPHSCSFLLGVLMSSDMSESSFRASFFDPTHSRVKVVDSWLRMSGVSRCVSTLRTCPSLGRIHRGRLVSFAKAHRTYHSNQFAIQIRIQMSALDSF